MFLMEDPTWLLTQWAQWASLLMTISYNDCSGPKYFEPGGAQSLGYLGHGTKDDC